MSSKSRRLWFISVSIVGHLAVGIGVYASGVWRIERLDADHRSMSTLAVLAQAAPSGGGPVALPKVDLKPKPKPVVTVLTQPPVVRPAVTATTTTVTTTIIGEGSGEGSGSGSGSAGSKGTCLIEPCSDTPTAAQPPKDPPKDDAPVFVPPNVLTMMRTSGTTQVHPPDVVKNQMLRDGKDRSVAVLKICVSETGDVTSVNVLNSTRYPAFDERLIGAVHNWTYKPYAAKGRNVKVCGTVTFIYSIK